ncbi:ADP-ribosylation factor-binding protein GGA2 [Uranotaenia lowii]|uniref:ADP-ribosylation factor-binding protein GGA2 n=1 Tax=Uranotaenia lowii TaxID=190385 RepID=UPI00247AF0DF|nr:ADP-ribosylation factor-binding protein GGA2 [Uranotaenia lowii]
MDVLATLETYLANAVNPSNSELDISAIDHFCWTLKKNPKLVGYASQLLVNHIQSSNVREALLALEALEECMETCGPDFRSVINKFRFLNQLIKLVSKKYEGHKTPEEVSDRILNILLTWTNKYDSYSKIQEAYNMLKSQGIEHHPQQNVVLKSAPKANPTRDVLDDRESATLKKLIASNKPEDREKANLLIQNRIRDEERRIQIKNRRIDELNKVADNTKLLSDTLSQFQPNVASEDELTVVRQIYDSCQSMHPTILRLAEETQQSEGLLERILQVNDDLTQALDRYREIIPKHALAPSEHPDLASLTSAVSHPSTGSMNITGSDPLDTLFDVSNIPSGSEVVGQNVLDDLSEIFSSTVSTDNHAVKPFVSSTSSSSLAVNTNTMLTPLVVSNGNSHKPQIKTSVLLNGIENGTKIKDNLLLLEELRNYTPKKDEPTNVTRSTDFESTGSCGKPLGDLDFIVSDIKSSLLSRASMVGSTVNETKNQSVESQHSDDDDNLLVPVTPIIESRDLSASMSSSIEPVFIRTEPEKSSFKSLAEIVVDLDSIQPSKEPARTVWDDKEGLQITLNFSSDHPREDVTVIVISTINQGRESIPSFYFDASVKKPCKLRLLPASGTSLPGTKPFRPPADGITQVLLLANPEGKPVDLTCIVTYCLGNDPDPIKESIVMKDIPFTRE